MSAVTGDLDEILSRKGVGLHEDRYEGLVEHLGLFGVGDSAERSMPRLEWPWIDDLRRNHQGISARHSNHGDGASSGRSFKSHDRILSAGNAPGRRGPVDHSSVGS